MCVYVYEYIYMEWLEKGHNPDLDCWESTRKPKRQTQKKKRKLL